MRNIAFVITLYMLSMFSIHAQHSYYKLDRESNALQQIPETNELRDFLYDSESRWILDSDGIVTNQINNLHTKHSFEIYESSYLTNELFQEKDINHLVFKNIKSHSTLNQLDLTNKFSLEKIVFMFYEEIDVNVLLSLINSLENINTTEIFFIKGSLN